ncbi:hypothetical protein DSCO28_04540 [Desulfosarcina ovata subsp. sediminis]|uniref:PilZ domain-containing protein n=1 Tax=Desulfosarcina ovata subsp. sediminis TaxID=885957 RepID=A0A5K7ZCI5_9BACT|nr:PilZ domain-containing protein [Desulfosarcina ovata]BBO79888.1 hypothetical protein DSCO28_04540 [Desulfosarcina ovata subsp. sediminis]
MHGSNWQAERKKILARLSIAIYKMSDQQLISLLHLFNDLDLADNNKRFDGSGLFTKDSDGNKNRQLLIAHFFLLINQLSEADLLKFMKSYEQKRFAMLREYPRINCNFTLDLATDDRAINCYARDISASGVYLETCEAFTIGQPVSLCFSLEESRLALKLKGRVVRMEHGGVGIKYESISSYQLEIMRDLINRLDDPDDSGKELAGGR